MHRVPHDAGALQPGPVRCSCSASLRIRSLYAAVNFRRTVFSGTSGSGTALGCVITVFFSSTIIFSFPPSESKLLGGKCLTYIGTEGIVNDKENKIGLFVTLSSRKGAQPLLLETLDDKNTIEVMGIEVVRPGTYKTACGKGYWKCKKGEAHELKLHRAGIDFFRFESANSYFIWHAGKKKFERTWISD